MIARSIGYVMVLVGSFGFFTLSDPDAKYPAAMLGIVGVIVVLEGTIAQLVAAIREKDLD